MTKITEKALMKRLDFWANRKGIFARKEQAKWQIELNNWYQTHAD